MAKYKYNYGDIKDCIVVSKEPEIRAAYPELKTLHLENVANITINSDIISPQKKIWDIGILPGILSDYLQKIQGK